MGKKNREKDAKAAIFSRFFLSLQEGVSDWLCLLHHLSSGSGAVTVGGNDDGHAVSLLHLLSPSS